MAAWWERLDIRRMTLVDALMTEAAKVIAEDLLAWPPAVHDLDAKAAAEFSTLLEPGTPRPPITALVEGVRLARWDLEHEFDAFDDYVRNRRWTEHGLADDQKPVLLFLSRWIPLHLDALRDATEGRVKRKDLVVCLDRLEKRLRTSLS